ncbi:helix-turn-helix transcriptional regulator, partial [Streptococcus suis]
MYLPNKLKAKRQELRLRQQDIAEQLGISKQAYSKWEKGLSQPTKTNFIKLEELLHVPSGYLS